MHAPTRVFRSLPSTLWAYTKVLSSKKPLLAPEGASMPPLEFVAKSVRLRAGHVARYRTVCGMTDDTQHAQVPHAYPHVLAMPLHMHIFAHPQFPVKVLGLVHLRNVIRQHRAIPADASVTLSAACAGWRETGNGQEYDIVTRAHLGDELVWEEVSTMLARRYTPGQRPRIERANRDAERVLREQNVVAPVNTGRRYAWVSGDFNPIHLADRPAQWFQFKQCVAHGMWSLSRCIGLAKADFPAGAIEIDAEFKLPIYLPSEFIFRSQRADDGLGLSLTTPKGDRLHLSVQVKPLR